jgi:hypothetical protein
MLWPTARRCTTNCQKEEQQLQAAAAFGGGVGRGLGVGGGVGGGWFLVQILDTALWSDGTRRAHRRESREWAINSEGTGQGDFDYGNLQQFWFPSNKPFKAQR